MRRFLFFLFLSLCGAVICSAEPPLTLPSETEKILKDIYSARIDQAVNEAQQLQQQMPNHPLGYILEAEALWWKIWCSSAEFKYGMTLPRHREKIASDQHYFDISTKALAIAEARLKEHESAEMYFYAGMAEAASSRLYGLRWEYRNTARAGVHARDNFVRALALDPQLADADFGLGLYDYYVDTLSTMARVMRFFMGIPGGTKEEGMQLLDRSIRSGQLTSALSRFYLAINLHNYDQRYEEALFVLTPLVENYPDNPLFWLAQGDLFGKLGRKAQALQAYKKAEATTAKVSDPAMHQKISLLLQQSIAALSGPGSTKP